MARTSTTSSARFHSLIISLLFVILLGTLILVGLLVTRSKPTIPQASVAACQDHIETAVAEAQAECEAQEEPTETVRTQSVPSRQGTIGFEYPVEWSVLTGNNIAVEPRWYAQLMYGHIPTCDACDGPIHDVRMSVSAKNTPDFQAFVASQYADPSYENIVITPSDDVGGERYTVTGEQNGLFVGPFEAIYFEGPSLYAVITFFDTDTRDTTTNDDWEVIKDSLDFSGLQQ